MVAVTAVSDGNHRTQAVAAGFEEYLVTPYPATELLRLVAKVQEIIADSKRCSKVSRQQTLQGRQRRRD